MTNGRQFIHIFVNRAIPVTVDKSVRKTVSQTLKYRTILLSIPVNSTQSLRFIQPMGESVFSPATVEKNGRDPRRNAIPHPSRGPNRPFLVDDLSQFGHLTAAHIGNIREWATRSFGFVDLVRHSSARTKVTPAEKAGRTVLTLIQLLRELMTRCFPEFRAIRC